MQGVRNNSCELSRMLIGDEDIEFCVSKQKQLLMAMILALNTRLTRVSVTKRDARVHELSFQRHDAMLVFGLKLYRNIRSSLTSRMQDPHLA